MSVGLATLRSSSGTFNVFERRDSVSAPKANGKGSKFFSTHNAEQVTPGGELFSAQNCSNEVPKAESENPFHITTHPLEDGNPASSQEIELNSRVSIKQNEDNTVTIEQGNKISEYGKPLLSIVYGGLYIFVNAAGIEQLSQTFNITNNEGKNALLYTVGAFNCYCVGSHFLKCVENLELIPRTPFTMAMCVLAIFASVNFLTGGIAGAAYYGLGTQVGIPIGLVLFVFRLITLLDGVNKSPKKFKELWKSLKTAYAEGNWTKEIIFLFIPMATAFLFSLSKTDSSFAGLRTLANLVNIKDSLGLRVFCYIGTAFGFVGLLFMPFYWAVLGLNLISTGDQYAIFAMLIGSSLFIGNLGSAVAAGGDVLGKLDGGNIIRILGSALSPPLSQVVPLKASLENWVPPIITHVTAFVCLLSQCMAAVYYVITGRDREIVI